MTGVHTCALPIYGHNDIPLIEFGVHGSVMSCADEDVKAHAQVEYDSVSDLISKNL